MKTIIKNKIVMVMAVLAFTFAWSQNSVTMEITGQTKVNNVGGKEAPNEDSDGAPAEFVEGGSNLDSFSIGFKAVVDNVTASVTIVDDTDAGANLKFDAAYIEVADLFDGLLTFKFFDVGYGAGADDSIRPDLGSHGLKVTVKPIDMLSIGLGYGIATKDFNHYRRASADVTNTAVSIFSNGQAGLEDTQYHAIQLDIDINNAFVPATVYAGVVIVDGNDYKLPKSPAGLPTVAEEDPESVKILHASAGFTADVLAVLLPGAVNLDVGAVFPMFGAATFLNPEATGDYENQLNLVAVLHGGISDLGVEGLGLDYSLAFALDTETKQQTLGDLDDDYFKELLKVSITPSYSIGQFKIALNGVFGMIGEKAAMYSTGGNDDNTALHTKAYNRFEATPSVTWSPSDIASVKGYFTFEDSNMDSDDGSNMKLGLDYTMTIGVEGL